MKVFTHALMIVSAATLWLASDGFAKDTTVRGHITKSGNYVPPHRRTTPDRSKANNYGSVGNVNPYTGKAGTRDPAKP